MYSLLDMRNVTAPTPADAPRLLYITQKLHGQDAFILQWVRAFRAEGFEVTVLCLEDRVSPRDFEIFSMGKERGFSKIRQVLRFLRFILTLRYDRVFIHLNPIWGMLGAWYWVPRRMPVYLWYTHYTYSIPFRVTASYAKRLFCATRQSMPQLESSAKKVVIGHGIDLSVWRRQSNVARSPHALLVVHRLSRSKRLELNIQAMKLLPDDYKMDVYGIEAEPDYVREMHELVSALGLQNRVRFHGSVSTEQLQSLYVQYRLILNMASETIDKTMLEAMTCGCYPVTTKRNADAIGIPAAPEQDTPEAIAAFVRRCEASLPMEAEALFRVVEERHSLSRLVSTMDSYIRLGQ